MGGSLIIEPPIGYDMNLTALMKVLHTIRDTPPNPRGLCTLSINSDNCYLAYPGSTTTGEVQLFDAFNLQVCRLTVNHTINIYVLREN